MYQFFYCFFVWIFHSFENKITCLSFDEFLEKEKNRDPTEDFSDTSQWSSHRRCSFKKDVLNNFAKFTGKHLCWSLFSSKVAGCNFVKKESDASVFVWILQNLKEHLCTEHFLTTASDFTSWRLFSRKPSKPRLRYPSKVKDRDLPTEKFSGWLFNPFQAYVLWYLHRKRKICFKRKTNNTKSMKNFVTKKILLVVICSLVCCH